MAADKNPAPEEKIALKGGTLLAPLPAVIVSCGDMEKPNLITIGWTGILNTHPPKTYISVRPERYSYELLKKTRRFTINLVSRDLVRAADFCGVRSGKDVNKAEACSLHLIPGLAHPDTPMIAESPVSIECAVSDIVPLGTHDMFIADIVSAAVSGSLMDEKGGLRLDRAGLICYAHGEYFGLGPKLGSFGFSVMKKSTAKRKRAEQQKTRSGKK